MLQSEVARLGAGHSYCTMGQPRTVPCRATTVSPPKLFVRCGGDLSAFECVTLFWELFYHFRWTICCRFSWLLLALQVINSAWNRSSAIVTLDSFRSHVDLPSCNLIAPCRLRQISGHRVLHLFWCCCRHQHDRSLFFSHPVPGAAVIFVHFTRAADASHYIGSCVNLVYPIPHTYGLLPMA